MISCFKSVKDAKNPFDATVEGLLERFKTEEREIPSLRNLRGEEFKKAKSELPVACFGGKFSARSKNAIISGSGLMILDFDANHISELESVNERLRKNKHVYAVFLSTSGNGYKALVKIPETKSDAEYKEYFNAFSEDFSEIDESGKDISRACFFTYDPDLYVNKSAKIFKKKQQESKKPMINDIVASKNDYSVANKVLNMIRYAQVGERHDKILKASRLMGGFVAIGAMEYNEAVRLLEQEAYAIDPSDFSVNQKAVIDGLQNGMQDPVDNYTVKKKELEEELSQDKTEEKFGKIYFTAFDKDKEIDDLFENGVQKGYHVGFEEIKDLYTCKMGGTTYVYGAPFSGKSEVWFEFLINMSVQYNLRHAIFSSETGNAAEIFAKLIEMVAMQDFYDTYGRKMQKEKMQEAKEFVDKHFIIVDPGDEVLTYTEFYDFMDIIERVYNVKIHTTTIDPWNELRHDMNEFRGARDLYMESILGDVRRNARLRDRHNCIITHVSNQQIIMDKDTGVRYYPPATPREIAWGEAWYRKGMMMISVWRPPSGMTGRDGVPYEDNESHIIIDKAKPKGTGKKGVGKLYYSGKKHRFYEGMNEMTGLSRKIEDEVQIETKYNLVQPNLDFDKPQITDEDLPF